MGKAVNSELLVWRLVFPILLFLTVVIGCGKSVPTGTVRGKVTLDGQPYSNASVVLLGADTGQAGTADIQADGTFSMANPLPVGSYMAYLAPKASVGAAEEAAPVKIDTSVPEKYWSEMSDIKVDVAEGENDVTIAMESGG
jgi:hypothetical protein